MKGSVKLALIYGSAHEGRFCDTIVNWAVSEICLYGGFELQLIDPVHLHHPTQLTPHPHAVLNLKKQLAWADAFIVATPEYNHGYPAPLKGLIDSAYEEWQAKPVAFISYGGISGGLRAVEQLRLVFAELHAVGIRDSVSFSNPWNKFSVEGILTEPQASRLALARMLASLQWWAQALRAAREATPYGKMAAPFLA